MTARSTSAAVVETWNERRSLPAPTDAPIPASTMAAVDAGSAAAETMAEFLSETRTSCVSCRSCCATASRLFTVQNVYSVEVSEIGVTEARDQLGDLVNRAAYSDERIVLTRHGRPVAALVPIAVLRELEDAEDAADLAAARAAAAERGPNVPHAQVLADLVDDEARTSA